MKGSVARGRDFWRVHREHDPKLGHVRTRGRGEPGDQEARRVKGEKE